MDHLPTLFSIAAVWGIAAATPGPNFFVTLRSVMAQSHSQSQGQSRGHGFAAVGGIVTGTAIWGLAGFFGISTLFALAPWLYAGLKIVGGAYLVYLGLRLIAGSFRKAPRAAAPAVSAGPGGWAAWRLGLLTNLSNPKTAAFVTSLFASTLPAEPGISLGLMAVAVMTGVSLAWYGSVAWIFATPRMTRLYARAAHLIDRLAGGIFVLFGAKLALDR